VDQVLSNVLKFSERGRLLFLFVRRFIHAGFILCNFFRRKTTTVHFLETGARLFHFLTVVNSTVEFMRNVLSSILHPKDF
jgi:hypothetical protein